MKPLSVLVLADGGIGGTEKAASIYAAELVRRGYEVFFSGNRGPRTQFLEESGVRIIPKANDKVELATIINEIKPSVIHQHVPGYPIENPLYTALDLISNRPKIIQTNVFGHLSDPRALETVDFHLFVSKASGAQAFRRSNLPLDERWLSKCTVLMNPMPVRHNVDLTFRSAFRKAHKISENTLLAIRVGQPGMGKWTDWEVKATLAASDLGVDVKLILMQPPDELLPRFASAMNRGLLRILPATSDFSYLNNVYSAADVMLHASFFGESFGYTIAEGMAAGLPVICRSTPWGDSAQVELVENGITGWTCATPSEMGRQLASFFHHPECVTSMGAAGRERITNLSDLGREIDLLEEILNYLVLGAAAPRITARNEELLSFYHDLPRRERTFSESTLPFGERIQWFGYFLYRKIRSTAKNRFTTLRRLGH